MRTPEWVWVSYAADMPVVYGWWREYVNDMTGVAAAAVDVATRGAAEAGVRALHTMEWVASDTVAVAHTLPDRVLEFNVAALANRAVFRRVMAVELPHQIPLGENWCRERLASLALLLSTPTPA